MDSHNNKSAFWPSYVDIMTTLFAIMLVLFAVSYSRFKIKQRELEEFKDKYEEIMAIYKAVDNIDPEYFEFNKEYLKHIFKIQVNYQKGKFSLDNLLQDDPNSAEYNLTKANAIRQQIIDAGEEIKKTILNLQLSYQGALKLHEFWRDKAEIDFTNMDKCELVIAGSGEHGVPRAPRINDKDDSRNQRFLIHIVPVISDIHLNPKLSK